MDAVIQVEAAEFRAVVTKSVVIISGESIITSVPTWVTVLIDKLELIKESIRANAPNKIVLIG